MAGRFNRILELIGLVDDEPYDEREQPRNRPAGGQTYDAPQSRRAQPTPPPPRAPRGAPEYDAGRSGGRYATSPRPDYDARQRRDSAATPPPRYGSDYRSAPRGDYPPPRDYQSPYRSGEYRGGRSDPMDDEFERFERQTSPPPRQPRDGGARESAPPPRGNNVVPMRAQTPAGHQTVIYYLRNLEECREVINDLLDTKSVLLNLEDMDTDSVQRSIDTLCGAAFALGATLRKASDKTYLIAPNNVLVDSPNDSARRY